MNNIICLDLSAPRKIMVNNYNKLMLNYKVSNHKKDVDCVVKVIEGTLFITIIYNIPVYAGVKDQIVKAFNPIVDIIQALGYPVCLSLSLAGGVTMAFNRKQGIKMIKDAAIAFLVIQFVPQIMKILIGVGDAMK
jgi:hypothetical protein